MIRTLVSLNLLGTLFLVQTLEVPHPMPLVVVRLGDNVTLSCPLPQGEVRFVFWYKQSVGRMVQTVAVQSLDSATFHEQFNNTRFSVRKSVSEFNLIIRNVIREDEATYFCQGGTAYKMFNLNGTYLRVNDYNQQKSVLLTQWPETESVQLGEAVTLQCSVVFENKERSSWCSGEHSVYWFRAGSGESHPGVIHSRGNRSHECQESPSRQRSCVYTLSKSVTSSSDAGTYYCAVATCGEMLFGSGTKVDTRSELFPVDIVLGTLLACSSIVIVVLIFSRNRRRICQHCKGTVTATDHLGLEKSTMHHPSDLNTEAQELNYAALNFSSRKAKRGQKKRELPTESIYSAVRTDE
ncbi:vascular endothelial growth factor receptor 1-like [Myripristis murdjan]|uniref:vascular endothelial growth factor receptor 1-like n=1 Tax=Myripristis murdjan TaxID=586833 RepID=UPI001175E0B5|nr:vascular endothelial growth factor receptor 1-like [Myripristis murdjan]